MFTLGWTVGIPILFLAIVVHEYAHGWMAEKSGDDTARVMGRITLNPLAHIDPFGTIFLPIFLILTHSPILFGWAKPVPIDPTKFRSYKIDTIKVSLSGPAANFLLGILFAFFIWVISIFHSKIDLYNLGIWEHIIRVFGLGVLLNFILAVFNLIPIPPLDGFRVISAILPERIAYRIERLSPFGFFLILLLFYSRIPSYYIWPFVEMLYRLVFSGIGHEFRVLLSLI